MATAPKLYTYFNQPVSCLLGDTYFRTDLTAFVQGIIAPVAAPTVTLASLGTGTPSATTFLRGDGSWQPITTSGSAFTFSGAAYQYVKGDGQYAVFPTSLAAFTNDPGYMTLGASNARYASVVHGHVISDVTGLQAALNSKQGTITPGSATQYLKGDLTLGSFPTTVSSLTNDAGYVTAGTADARYAQVGLTYTNPSWIALLPFSKISDRPGTLAGYGITDAAPLVHTHAISDVNGLQTALNTKQPIITLGSTSQYLKGDLSLGTLPTSLSAFTNDSGYLLPATGDVRYPQLTILYNDPAWLHSLAFSKITGSATTSQLAAGTPAEGYIPKIVSGVITWAPDATASSGALATTTGNNGKWLTNDGTNNLWASLSGNVSLFTNDAGYVTSVSGLPFSSITTKPTTLSGYGITDAANIIHTHLISDVTGLQASLDSKQATITPGTSAQYIRGNLTVGSFPTTLSGYGITDAAPLVHTHDASAIVSGVIPTARLGSGVQDTTTFLRGDGTWAVVSTGGTGYSFSGTTVQYTKGDGSYATFPTAVSAFSNDSGYMTSLAGKTTDTLSEGTANLYFTAARVQTTGDARYPLLTGAYANPSWITSLPGSKLTGTISADLLTSGSTNHVFTAVEDTKLASITAGATANSTDAFLLSRTNHTGTQVASTISDFATAADARITAQKNIPSGIPGLNASSKLIADVLVDGATIGAYTLTERAKLSGIAAGATTNSADSYLLSRVNHTGTQSADTLTDGTTNKAFLATERTKLSGIATGATVNQADAYLLSRANHTGTQSADTLTDGTTNKAFLATERTKLAGIATGATVNQTDAYLLNRANQTGTQSADTLVDGTTNKVLTASQVTTWNAKQDPVNFAFTTLSYSSAVTWTFSHLQPQALLAANSSTAVSSTLTLSNTGDGDSGRLVISYATGSEVITLPGSFLNGGKLSPAAGAQDFCFFEVRNGVVYWTVDKTGVPVAPTATSGTNTTQVATTAFVQTAVAGVTAPPPADGSITNLKLATDVKVGSLASLTSTAKTDVVSALNEVVSNVASKAPTVSPSLSGLPTAPTATTGTNTTQIATTAFVQAAVSGVSTPVPVTQVVTSGSTVSINNNTAWFIFDPTATVAALTLTLAVAPTDGQVVDISFGGTLISGAVVSNLTMAASTGKTILQPDTPSLLNAGESLRYRYNAAKAIWYRLK